MLDQDRIHPLCIGSCACWPIHAADSWCSCSEKMSLSYYVDGTDRTPSSTLGGTEAGDRSLERLLPPHVTRGAVIPPTGFVHISSFLYLKKNINTLTRCVTDKNNKFICKSYTCNFVALHLLFFHYKSNSLSTSS